MNREFENVGIVAGLPAVVRPRAEGPIREQTMDFRPFADVFRRVVHATVEMARTLHRFKIIRFIAAMAVAFDWRCPMRIFLRPQCVCRIMPSRDNAIELLPEFNLFRGRRLRQSLVPQFPDGDPLDTGVSSSDDPPPDEKKRPGGRPPSPAEFPTDVPAPSPHDVPAWEPVDDPPPEPDEAPRPRPIP